MCLIAFPGIAIAQVDIAHHGLLLVNGCEEQLRDEHGQIALFSCGDPLGTQCGMSKIGHGHIVKQEGSNILNGNRIGLMCIHQLSHRDIQSGGIVKMLLGEV